MLTLDQVKSHLRITTDVEDADLTDLLAEAQQHLADDLGVAVSALDAQPAPVMRALRFLIAHWYENREVLTSDSRPQNVPLAYDSIVWKYRQTGFA